MWNLFNWKIRVVVVVVYFFFLVYIAWKNTDQKKNTDFYFVCIANFKEAKDIKFCISDIGTFVKTLNVKSFVIVQSLSHVWLFATPWTAASQASLSFTISQSLLRLTSIELVMPSNHLTLCQKLYFFNYSSTVIAICPFCAENTFRNRTSGILSPCTGWIVCSSGLLFFPVQLLVPVSAPRAIAGLLWSCLPTPAHLWWLPSLFQTSSGELQCVFWDKLYSFSYKVQHILSYKAVQVI